MQRRSNKKFKALYFVYQGANGKYSNKHFCVEMKRSMDHLNARIKGLNKLVYTSPHPSDDSISNSCWKISFLI